MSVPLDRLFAADAGQRRVPVVAGEHLVGALPGLHHPDRLADPLRQQVEGDDVVADHRLGHRTDGVAESCGELVGGHPDAVVVGVEALGDDVGVDELVALPAADRLEADRVGGQAGLSLLGEQADDEAGVQAAGEQHADRDVGHQPPADGDPQRLLDRVLPVARGPGGVLGTALVAGLPVPVLAGGAVGLDHPHGGRGQLADAAQDRPRRGDDGVPGEVVVQRDGVDGGVDVPRLHERREGGGEPQPAGRLGEVQRLDAQPVAGEHHAPGVPLGDDEREHPVQVRDDVGAPVVVALEDHLGVAGGEEAVAVALELGAQLLVVVDAAVEDRGQAELVVDHRLAAGR
jgi:hypothetical protein